VQKENSDSKGSSWPNGVRLNVGFGGDSSDAYAVLVVVAGEMVVLEGIWSLGDARGLVK
jgi:hypothetical protein